MTTLPEKQHCHPPFDSSEPSSTHAFHHFPVRVHKHSLISDTQPSQCPTPHPVTSQCLIHMSQCKTTHPIMQGLVNHKSSSWKSPSTIPPVSSKESEDDLTSSGTMSAGLYRGSSTIICSGFNQGLYSGRFLLFQAG